MKLSSLLKPFGAAALLCWAGLVISVALRGENLLTQLIWGTAVWALASLGFAGTAMLVHALLAFRAGATEEEQPQLLRRLFLGLSIKLTCFALVGVVVWAGREKAEFGILIATLTLLLVPVGGGIAHYRHSNQTINPSSDQSS